MSHETAQQVTPAELHEAIDSAAEQARKTGGYDRKNYLHVLFLAVGFPLILHHLVLQPFYSSHYYLAR